MSAIQKATQKEEGRKQPSPSPPPSPPSSPHLLLTLRAGLLLICQTGLGLESKFGFNISESFFGWWYISFSPLFGRCFLFGWSSTT